MFAFFNTGSQIKTSALLYKLLWKYMGTKDDKSPICNIHENNVMIWIYLTAGILLCTATINMHYMQFCKCLCMTI